MTQRPVPADGPAVAPPTIRALPALRTGAVIVVLLALAGAALAVKLILAGSPTDPNRPAYEVQIANPAPTSFGTVAVEFAQFLGGPSVNALTGANHNVGALVGPDKMQVEATVTITNASKHPVEYSPAQFDLLIGTRPKALGPTRASAAPGTLQPDAAIDERLVFVTDLTTAKLTLRYRETPTSAPVLVHLGRGTGQPQRAHGEKPGEVLGVGQTFHEHQQQGTTP